jgi:predicted membrane metal-binding protein
MNIELPAIPSGVLVLLALLAPYLQALIQRPKWSPTVKKILAIVLAIILTAVVLAFYYVYTGDVVPAWPALILLAIVVAQASYALVAKSSATVIEQTFNPGTTLRRDLR